MSAVLSTEVSTLPELLATRSREIEDEPFLRYADVRCTYGEFDARTDALAGGLAELGVEPGDVVSVMLPNCLEFLEAWWAILKAGAVFGPINPAFTAPEAAYVLGHSQAVAVVTDRHGARRRWPAHRDARSWRAAPRDLGGRRAAT